MTAKGTFNFMSLPPPPPADLLATQLLDPLLMTGVIKFGERIGLLSSYSLHG